MLSKSDYLSYLKHPAWAWLKKNDKQQLPPIDDATQAIFDEGNLFEQYVQQLFPSAAQLSWSGYSEYKTLPARTREALDNGASAILQGRFETDTLTCIVDVLDRVEGDAFDLYEVKSSTKVKDEHIDDLAFQTIVLEECGLTLRSIQVIHCNNAYVREGDVDSEGLTVVADVTDRVRNHIDRIKHEIDNALHVVAQPDPPDLSPRHASTTYFKDWMEVYRHIYPDIPSDSIYNLPGLKPGLVAELEDAGIRSIPEIPDTMLLGKKPLAYIQLVRRDEPVIDHVSIQEFLDSLDYPLYFLDYETYGSVVPPYEGVRPYQQVPFQYSIHRIDSVDAEPVHLEYLHADTDNPSEPLVSSLNEHIGDTGSIIVWNEGFEKGCNDGLADMVPHHAAFLRSLNDRIIDLMIPFARGWYQHQGFYGSASINAVLPVLVPSLSYKELEVSDGTAAQRLWAQTILQGDNKDRREEVLSNLREYCQLDTFAMVAIWRYLQKTG